MPTQLRSHLLLLALALVLAGCATLRVQTQPGLYSGFEPRREDRVLSERLRAAGLERDFRRDPEKTARRLIERGSATGPAERLLAARALIRAAVRKDRVGAEQEAVGRYLEAAAEAESVLRDRRAGAYRNEALEIYATASKAALRIWTGEVGPDGPPPQWTAHGIRGERTLAPTTVPGRDWPVERFTDLVPSDTIRRRRLQPRVTADGLGLPLVGEIPRRRGELAPRISEVAVTAVLDPADRPTERDQLRLFNPNRTDSVLLAGKPHPIAADFSTPLDRELLLHRGIRTMEILGVLNPAKFLSREGIYVLDPFDPDRIPVVFIHGLQSSSFAWLPMLNGLSADPEIRRRYQFWVYQYPTGLPISLASAKVREHLDKVHALYRKAGRERNGNRMVLVGHSMGGLHSRMQIIDSGDAFYSSLTQIPLDRLPLSHAMRESIRKAVWFERRPYVSRVIFIATPHRGSEIAANWIGRLTIALIRIPGDLIGTSTDLLTIRKGVPGLLLRRPPTSVSGLQPNSPFIRALNSRPLPATVPVHSIIGDRGRGDTPRSSDGVVPYWSSHLDSAVSEKIVPSDHGALQHPEGIEETRRILLEHLGKQD